MNIFKVIGHFFENVYHLFKLPGQAEKAQQILDEVQKHIPDALKVVQEIENIVPNRETEAILALAAQYDLTANAAMTSDELETVLQNAALSELKKLVDGNVKNSTLRSAIDIAVNLLKASR